MCKIDDYKYRIITNDGQYTLDITKKINELDQVDISDVVGNTHLHFKKKTNIDLENIKFISCQILK
jgi:predicted membrane protein